MTRRFPLAALQPGMTLAVGICHDGGVLLPAGATISDRHLRQLSSWGITEVEPETPVASFADLIRGADGKLVEIVDLKAVGLEPGAPRWEPRGQLSADGRVLLVTEPVTWIDDVIRLERPTVIQGSIGPHVRIEAAGDLQVDGDIGTGARITATGDLAVRGEVLGTLDRPVHLEAERLSLHGARHAALTARTSLHAVDLFRCQAKAGQEIHVAGTEKGVTASDLEAGSRIRCGTAGGEEGRDAILRVTLTRQKQLYQVVVQLERAIAAAEEEMGRLGKVMEVIRLLGEKVVALPPEKKQELALQSKRYRELGGEIEQLREKRERALAETEQDVSEITQCPVQIERLLPGIQVIIGSANLRLLARQNATGYTLKNGRIRALSSH